MKVFVICILVVLMFAQTQALFGQEILSADSSIEKKGSLESVVVSADRKKTDIHLLPHSAVKLTAKDWLLWQTRTTPESLIGLPGVFVQKTNHGGGAISLRGLMGNQILMLFDGIRLNNTTYRYGPNQYLNTIDPFGLGSLEVLMGTGSVQYGSDAMGGVVHAISKDIHFSTLPETRCAVAKRIATSNQEKTTRAEVTLMNKRTALSIGATLRNYGDLVGGAGIGKQTPSGYNEIGWQTKYLSQLNNSYSLTIYHHYQKQNNIPLFHRVQLENFKYYTTEIQERSLSYLKLNANKSGSFFSNPSFTIGVQHSKEVRSFKKNGAMSSTKEMDNVLTGFAILNFETRFNKYLTSSSGIEFYFDDVKSVRKILSDSTNKITDVRGLYPSGSRASMLSAFSLSQLQLKNHSIRFGFRYGYHSLKIPAATNLPTSHFEFNAPIFNLSYQNLLSKNEQIYLSLSNGYRSPNLDDMATLGLVDFRYEIPARLLESEKSNHLEFGFKLKRKSATAQVAVYYMTIENLIDRVQLRDSMLQGYPVFEKRNVASAVVKGFDFSTTWSLTSQIQLQSSISGTIGTNESVGEPMRRIPPLFGRLALSKKSKMLFFQIETLIASAQKRLAKGDISDNRIGPNGTEGFIIANAHTGLFLRKWQFNLSLQNIWNSNYKYHGSGIAGQGRTLYLTSKFSF